MNKLKPATVHKEFRVLRRILNVAVQQRLLVANPCQRIEFPVRLSGSTRKPHYVTSSEQERIEFFAPSYLRNVVVIMVEMGLRPYKELLRMQKDQVDLVNDVLHIPDSKTSGGIADMPITALAKSAIEAQWRESGDSRYLFPSPRVATKKPYMSNLNKSWTTTLQRASIPHFSLYELRHTFATRLSAGGVADHFVAQALRQDDSAVFKRYSQAKLEMLRQALGQLDRRANERAESFGTANPN
jgi:integrase